MALNRSPVLKNQSYSVEGNDLNYLVEGNQACLFFSIVFERITRPYPLPHHTQTFSTYQILRLLHNKHQGSRLCGFRGDFFLSSLYTPI